MAIEYVNSVTTSNMTGTASTSINLPALNCATGDFIAICFSGTPAYITSITDTAGNSYASGYNGYVSYSDTNYEIRYAKNVNSNASNVITVNYASGNNIEVFAIQYSGVKKTGTIRGSYGGGSAIASDVTSVTTGAFSTSKDGELIVGMTRTAANPIDFTAGTNYIERQDGLMSMCQDRITTTKITSETMSMSSATATRWGALYVSFLPEPIPTPPSFFAFF